MPYGALQLFRLNSSAAALLLPLNFCPFTALLAFKNLMDLAWRAAVVRSLGFVLASTGFMLSVLAVILNPLFSPWEDPPPLLQHRLSVRDPSRDGRESLTSTSVTVSSENTDRTSARTSSPQPLRPPSPQPLRPPSPADVPPRQPPPLPPRRLADMPLSPSYPSTSETLHSDEIFSPPPPSPAASSGSERKSRRRAASQHSFHIPHLPIPKPGKQRRTQPSRCFSLPSPNLAREPSSTSPGVVERKGSVGHKLRCPTKGSLRKSTSAPAGELPTARRSKSVHHLPPVNEKPTTPAPRTNPYDAPYFFPLPGSPESINYVRQTQADRLRTAVSSENIRRTPTAMLLQQEIPPDGVGAATLQDRFVFDSPPPRIPPSPPAKTRSLSKKRVRRPLTME